MKTNQVFGVSSELIKTYVEREKVDDLFNAAIEKNKHIIIYGSSKQGKTSLINKHLEEDLNYIKVNCGPNSEIIDIYKSILRQANVEILESRTEERKSGGEVKTSLFAKIKIPIFEGGTKTEGALKKEKTKADNYKSIEYNLSLAQDFSELINTINFEKWIVLENFHYLSEEVQRSIAFDLRTFEEKKPLFIILGIWRESNRLIQYNGDLQDRIIEIPVEPWEHEDLVQIVNIGESLLNVSFEDVISNIINSCFDSVGVFQEICKISCLAGGVDETNDEKTYRITQSNLDEAIQRKLSDYSGRHIRSLESFIEQKAKSSSKTPLYIPYYFIKVLMEEDFKNVTTGLKRRELQEKIKAIHHRPDDVRPSDMGYFLKNLVDNQIKKRISPPIFEYDNSTSYLKIIDSTFYFFLKNTNKEELLEDLIPPEDIKDNFC